MSGEIRRRIPSPELYVPGMQPFAKAASRAVERRIAREVDGVLARAAVAHEAIAHQAAATQWQQDEALLAAARQMLGVMQACQTDGAAAAENGATTSRRRAGNGTGGSIDDPVDAGD